jgi:hypothetical protein
MDGISGVAVAKVILDQPEIIVPIREGEAAAEPKYVSMNRLRSGALTAAAIMYVANTQQ